MKECKGCLRASGCFTSATYIDFKTGTTILCPCINCIVRSICISYGCPYTLSYFDDLRNNSIDFSLLEEGDPRTELYRKSIEKSTRFSWKKV